MDGKNWIRSRTILWSITVAVAAGLQVALQAAQQAGLQMPPWATFVGAVASVLTLLAGVKIAALRPASVQPISGNARAGWMAAAAAGIVAMSGTLVAMSGGDPAEASGAAGSAPAQTEVQADAHPPSDAGAIQPEASDAQ